MCLGFIPARKQMSKFGFDQEDPYPKDNFINTYTKEQAEKLWKVKEALVDFSYACQTGVVKYYFPSLSFNMNEEMVNICIARIEKEWTYEQQTRGGIMYNNIPKFSEILDFNQKLALIERIVKQFPEWPKTCLIRAEGDLKKEKKLLRQ